MRRFKNTRTGIVFYVDSPVRGADIVALDAETPIVEEKGDEKPVAKEKKETKKNVSRKKPIRDSK